MCEYNDEYIRKIVAEEIKKLKRKNKEEVEETQKLKENVDEIDPDKKIPTLMVKGNFIKYYPKGNYYEVIAEDNQEDNQKDNQEEIGIDCEGVGVPFKKGDIYGCSINKKD